MEKIDEYLEGLCKDIENNPITSKKSSEEKKEFLEILSGDHNDPITTKDIEEFLKRRRPFD